MHTSFFLSEFEFLTAGVTLKIDEGQQNVITSFPRPNNAPMLVRLIIIIGERENVSTSFFVLNLNIKVPLWP